MLTAFIFVVNVALSRPLIEALLFSLAIAVGIAPEMMPAIVTVSLSAGSRALAAKKVLVKRLVAIEDLGNIEILFTDKTGTLTDGRITFARSLDADGQAESDRPLELGLVCNEATLTDEGPVGGNALDQALWSAPVAGSAGWSPRRSPGYRAAGRPPLRPRPAAGLGPGRRPRRRGALVVTRVPPKWSSRGAPTCPPVPRTSVMEATLRRRAPGWSPWRSARADGADGARRPPTSPA